MSLATNISDLATRIASEFKKVRTEMAALPTGGAETLSKIRPPINGYITPGISNANTPTPGIGELNLGLSFLPSGTYDRVAIRVANSTANATAKVVAYEMGSDSGLGALIFETTTIAAATSGFLAFDLTSALVIGAGGKSFWVGVVNQGTAAASFWSNNAPIAGFPRMTAPGVAIDLGGITGPSTLRVSGVTGAAPTSPTASYVDSTPARIAFRRSA